MAKQRRNLIVKKWRIEASRGGGYHRESPRKPQLFNVGAQLKAGYHRRKYVSTAYNIVNIESNQYQSSGGVSPAVFGWRKRRKWQL